MSKQAAQNTTNQITEGVIWKQLLIFFFPILFGTFFQQLYNTADAIIVGNFVGKEALASVGGSASTIINPVSYTHLFPATWSTPFDPSEPPMIVILSIWVRGSAILPAISGSTLISISAIAALLYF